MKSDPIAQAVAELPEELRAKMETFRAIVDANGTMLVSLIQSGMDHEQISRIVMPPLEEKARTNPEGVASVIYALICEREALREVQRERAASVREFIKSILLEFDWHNYGLDEVELSTADEWASDLALVIAEAIEKMP